MAEDLDLDALDGDLGPAAAPAGPSMVKPGSTAQAVRDEWSPERGDLPTTRVHAGRERSDLIARLAAGAEHDHVRRLLLLMHGVFLVGLVVALAQTFNPLAGFGLGVVVTGAWTAVLLRREHDVRLVAESRVQRAAQQTFRLPLGEDDGA
jgi:hypothetical protein